MINPELVKQSKISTAGSIPPKPEILLQIQRLLQQPDQLLTIAELLARDPGLSSAVLSHINSAYYFMRQKVSDIQQATILLGGKRIERLCYYYSLRQILSTLSTVPLEAFWLEAERTARYSVLLDTALDLRMPEEDLYTTGLFHDCGIPIMAQMFTDYAELQTQATRPDAPPLTQLEDERYGFNHAMVGYLLAEEWGLPENICLGILQHHEHDIGQSDMTRQQKQFLAVQITAENISHQATHQRLLADWDQHEAWIADFFGISCQQLAELQHNILHQAEG